MNIHSALLAAAGHIEKNPNDYLYACPRLIMINGYGNVGCAVSWVGFFTHLPNVGTINERCQLMFGIPYWGEDQGTFEGRANFLDTGHTYIDGRSWTQDAKRCATILRRYANKYHPIPTGIQA